MSSTILTQDHAVLLTGATSGIGRAAARRIAPMGARLTLVGRDPAKLDQTIASLKAESGNDRIDGIRADLSSMADIRALAATYSARTDRLDVLLNNAGAIFTDRRETAEGLESTLALNHLAYFELTRQLEGMLKSSAPARVVNVASQLHEKGRMAFGDLGLQNGYAPLRAYAQSKLANVMFTFDLAERLRADGVTVNALHPGVVASNFGRGNPGIVGRITAGVLWSMQTVFGVSVEQGADTLVYLGTSPEVAGETGKYWYKRRAIGVSNVARDPAQWARLWDESSRLVAGAVS